MPDSSRRSPAADGGDYSNPQFLRLVDELWSSLPRVEGKEGRVDEPVSTFPEPPAGDGTSVAIGRFEIRRELGRGGCGIVLLAFDPALRRSVALKVPLPEALLSSGSRHRFLSEARAAAGLRHPNIVAIHEAGEVGPIPYMVMDYCEGGSLAGWLAARPTAAPVCPRWAAGLVARISDGVQHAHDRGILHRDLKPSNILFEHGPGAHGEEPEFQPLVTDFGLARSLDATETGFDATLEGLPLGTIPYMANEAARGDTRSIGCATDVYGLGVILFELVTGRRPFAAPSRAELLAQVLSAEAPAPRGLRPDLPAELERIILNCLQKKPFERYQKPAELARDLRAFLDGRAAPARSETRPLAGRRVALRLGMALLVALFVSGAGFWWRGLKGRTDPRPLLLRLETAGLAALPELVPKLDPSDPVVAEKLARLYAGGSADQKLAAALVLAKVAREPRDYCYERLLQAGSGPIGPLARLLQSRMAELPARLGEEVEANAPPGSDTEAHDRRRARAACALIGLGSRSAGWTLLKFAADPQARSFLIHELGPAGIAPETIVNHLRDERDPSIRRALIQSLGAVPDAGWTTGLRQRTQAHLLALYENDPDPGVHGSAKWLLLRWNLESELTEIDARLGSAPQRPAFGWRISPLGLTLVTIADPQSSRLIEVADTEVPIELFLKFRGDYTSREEVTPGARHPVSGVNYISAAQFCNWLSAQEGFAPRDLAYRTGRGLAIEPAEDQAERAGYRLLTTIEYERACRAGSAATRYYGGSDSLLSQYAWHGPVDLLRLHPVAGLKPNDFGLFDMLGNADEICQIQGIPSGAGSQAAVCGGSVCYKAASIQCNLRRGPFSAARDDSISAAFGFRVARTIVDSR